MRLKIRCEGKSKKFCKFFWTKQGLIGRKLQWEVAPCATLVVSACEPAPLAQPMANHLELAYPEKKSSGAGACETRRRHACCIAWHFLRPACACADAKFKNLRLAGPSSSACPCTAPGPQWFVGSLSLTTACGLSVRRPGDVSWGQLDSDCNMYCWYPVHCSRLTKIDNPSGLVYLLKYFAKYLRFPITLHLILIV